MTEIEITKKYDLEDRTLVFARQVRQFVRKIKKDTPNLEDGKQLVRSSGSIGANYIEANESLSKKDFVMRIKICRKEAKESQYWLRLINTSDGDICLETERAALEKESRELMCIFGSIVTKTQ